MLSLPTDEIPLPHLRLNYLWYERKGNHLHLLDLHTSSCLDTEYKKFLQCPPADISHEVPVHIYTPPQKGQLVWATSIWKVNFFHFLCTAPGETQKKLLVPIQRAQSWFWKPFDGACVPFPYKVNLAIGKAIHQKRVNVAFNLVEGSFLFKKTTKCVLNLSTRMVTMSDANTGEFPILHEKDIEALYRWNVEKYEVTEVKDVKDRFAAQLQNLAKADGSVVLKEGSSEWQQVANAFFVTMPQFRMKKGKKHEVNKIVEIKKLTNAHNRSQWKDSLAAMRNSHKDDPLRHHIEYTKLLWHGTGTLHPEVIQNSDGGWKPNYSSDKNLWGRGCYFATDAAYSATYAYNAPNGNKIMLLAEVVVGLGVQCLENSYIVDVPNGYDSVVGFRHGAWIYVTYDRAKAYPSYSVEWLEEA